jgi:hypothetical protein
MQTKKAHRITLATKFLSKLTDLGITASLIGESIGSDKPLVDFAPQHLMTETDKQIARGFNEEIVEILHRGW